MKTISVCSSGNSTLLLVLLHVTISGEKVPPFFVMKAKPNGRISRELTCETEFPKICFYEVQEKVWIDDGVQEPGATGKRGMRYSFALLETIFLV